MAALLKILTISIPGFSGLKSDLVSTCSGTKANPLGASSCRLWRASNATGSSDTFSFPGKYKDLLGNIST